MAVPSEWWSVVHVDNSTGVETPVAESPPPQIETDDMEEGSIEVKASLGRTYNTGDYSSLRIDFGVRFVGKVSQYQALRG